MPIRFFDRSNSDDPRNPRKSHRTEEVAIADSARRAEKNDNNTFLVFLDRIRQGNYAQTTPSSKDGTTAPPSSPTAKP